jgi:hypothetical protein
MIVTAEQAGSYVQLSRKLRIAKAAGGLVESARPIHEKTKQLLDDPDTNPTLVAIEEGDLVDVSALLAIGAIRPRNVTQARRLEKSGDLEPQAEPPRKAG